MSVFILKDAETLVALQPAEFASEDDFQQLLAKFPSLLSWDQNDGSPRRWLLLKREKAIPTEEEGSGRFSVDHLFVDQDGVPTLVEVKRHPIRGSAAKSSARCSITPQTPSCIGRSNSYGQNSRRTVRQGVLIRPRK